MAVTSIDRQTIKKAKDYRCTYISSGWGEAPLVDDGGMDSVTERIATLILLKIGMEGPRRVIISRTRKSGNHSYRDVMVEDNATITCLEDVANALEAWFIEGAGSKVEYSGHFLQISTMEEVPEGKSYVVENLWNKS